MPNKSNGALGVLEWSWVSEPRSSPVVDDKGGVSSLCEATSVSHDDRVVLERWGIVALRHVPAAALNDEQAQAIRLNGTIDIHQERRPRVHSKNDILLDPRLCKGRRHDEERQCHATPDVFDHGFTPVNLRR